MIVKEAIELIRGRINDEFDTGYTDERLINYLNDAVKYLSSAIIARHDPMLTKELLVEATGTDVPFNFIRFAGGFPIKRIGNKFYIADSSKCVASKYFFMPSDLKDVEDEMPFNTHEVYNTVVVNLACLYALNQHEFNISQDSALKQQFDSLLTEALGAIE